MPKHVTYPGPHAAVTVPGLSEPAVRGVEIEVESDLADALIAQGWTSGPQRAARERADETADAPPADSAPPADAGTEKADAPSAGETADVPRRRPTT